MDDLGLAWARFRDEFEVERARLFALLETSRAALASADVPVEAVRDTLELAEAELALMDLAIAAMHARLMAVQTLLSLTVAGMS